MNAGLQLVDALTAAGWTVVGSRTGVHARLQWRDDRDSVMVPLDPTAPECDSLLDAAITTLGAIADRGASAQRALDKLTELGVIL